MIRRVLVWLVLCVMVGCDDDGDSGRRERRRDDVVTQPGWPEPDRGGLKKKPRRRPGRTHAPSRDWGSGNGSGTGAPPDNAPVPEPSTLLTLAGGLAALAASRRRRRR